MLDIIIIIIIIIVVVVVVVGGDSDARVAKYICIRWNLIGQGQGRIYI